MNMQLGLLNTPFFKEYYRIIATDLINNKLRLSKLKSGLRNVTGVTLNLSWNVIFVSNSKNFAKKFLLNDIQVWRLCEAFANGSCRSNNNRYSNN